MIGVLMVIAIALVAAFFMVFVIMAMIQAGRGVGFLFKHVFGCIFGIIGDVLRVVGGVFGGAVFALLALGTLLIGRFSRANHYATSMSREFGVVGANLFSAAVRRPLRFLFLESLVDGVGTRVPRAVHEASDADRVRKGGRFPEYSITGTLPSGGSGAKLFTATSALHGTVVIKSFSFDEGSTLPQIVRESRALEAARRLGLVLDTHMEATRFWYVMPYRGGKHLGTVVEALHEKSGSKGLKGEALRAVLDHQVALVETLERFHREGLWHKDVKPDNIIVDGACTHLVDFGLITSLGSPLTLTTHGTEYFRDPEMVRQALKGAKVADIDGAKFDVYGAGAVLYFMVENTFPAHGALSQFEKPAPEVLRWIVRRAMTDYESRYESATAMLADLETVAAAADPFALRPADLPSVLGTTVERPRRKTTPPRRRATSPTTQPTPLHAGVRAPLVLLVLAVMASVAFLIFQATVPQALPLPTLRFAPVEVPTGLGRFILVSDVRSVHSKDLAPHIGSYLASLHEEGWRHVEDDPAATAALTVAVNQAGAGQGGPFDPVIITLLRLDLDGVVWLQEKHEDVEARLIIVPEDGQITGGACNDRGSMGALKDGLFATPKTRAAA
jgi:serine/threonine protein kinase